MVDKGLEQVEQKNKVSQNLHNSTILSKYSGCSIDISVDAQYVFHLGEGWSVYPAVGFTANDIGKWAAGLNIGGGFDFEVARNWDLSAGLKWQPMFDDWRKNPVVISIGAAYKF